MSYKKTAYYCNALTVKNTKCKSHVVQRNTKCWRHQIEKATRTKIIKHIVQPTQIKKPIYSKPPIRVETTKFKCDKIIIRSEILTFKEGLNLYHGTYRKTKESLDELKDSESKYNTLQTYADGSCMNDLQYLKFFGVGRNLPNYYIAHNDYTNKCTLKYTTKKTLHLIDVGNKLIDKLSYLLLINKSHKSNELYSEIDGWIGYDDPGDNWREVCLFRPIECLNLQAEEYIGDYISSDDKYIWSKEEVMDLKKKFLESFNIHICVDQDGIRAYNINPIKNTSSKSHIFQEIHNKTDLQNNFLN